MRHLITPMDLSVEETMNILDLAERISIGPQLYKHVADVRPLATLFFEPSMHTNVTANVLLHFSMSQVPEPVYLSSLLC